MNNKLGTKRSNQEKKLAINKSYFTLEFIPYDKVLSNLLTFLQMKLSAKIFNEIYKFSIAQIKKYLNANTSYINSMRNKKNINKIKTEILSHSHTNNSKQIISEFCFTNNNYENSQKNYLNKFKTKANLKKIIHPFIGLSYGQKLRYNLLNNKDIPIFQRNTSNNNSIFDEKNLSLIINGNNINNNNDISKIKKIKKINKTNNNSNNINKTKGKNDFNFFKIFLNNKCTYNTKTKKPKLDINYTLNNLPSSQYLNSLKINSKHMNKCKTRANSNLKNIKNAVVINNTFFNKFKNNYNFGLVQNKDQKLKVINIKLKDKDKNGSMRILTPAQNSEEMLDKIKNSLDDDNLKVMLNFSYENFLSKESERESKEYSIEG